MRILVGMSDTLTPVWTLGDRLRKARTVAGIGSEQMAAIVGVSRGTISNYENDHSDIPARALMKWADETGVPVDWLMGVDDPAFRSRCFSQSDEGGHAASGIEQLELFANRNTLVDDLKSLLAIVAVDAIAA